MPDTNVDIKSILDNLANADPIGEAEALRARNFLQRLGVGPLTRNIVAGTYGAMLSGFVVVIGFIIGIAVTIGRPIVTVFLRILTKSRTDTVPEQVDISASVLSEFLATDIDPAHLQMGKNADQTIAASKAIGGALIDRLTKEFVPAGGISNQSGEDAAKTFAGYAVNFAVQNTMIGTLADAISFHLLEDFRELGVEVAQNLGLGRLVRQAIQPLVRNAISQPYDRQLRARYRQDQIGDTQYIQSWFAGRLDETTMRAMLAQKGYSDQDIDLLIAVQRERLSVTDALRLFRFGVLGQQDAIQRVIDAGNEPTVAQEQFQAASLTRQDDQWSAYLGVIISQTTSRRIDIDTFNKLLDRVPLLDEEKQIIRDQVGEELEVPTSFLTWSEVVTAFENGLVDLGYVDDWLTREGFGDDDILNKEMLLLIRFNLFADKQALADAKKAGTAKTTKAPGTSA